MRVRVRESDILSVTCVRGGSKSKLFYYCNTEFIEPACISAVLVRYSSVVYRDGHVM